MFCEHMEFKILRLFFPERTLSWFKEEKDLCPALLLTDYVQVTHLSGPHFSPLCSQGDEVIER